MTSENYAAPVREIATLADQLRRAVRGVGRRIEGGQVRLRLQSFGNGRVGLTVQLVSRPKIRSSIKLVELQVRRLEGSWALDLIERNPGASTQSAAFFGDLVGRLRESPPESAELQVESALRAWNSAFSAKRELLTEEQMLGLFGELVLMKDMFSSSFSVDTIVAAWTGPEGEDHDYTFPGRFQVEVKSTAPHSERLYISNEHQLEAKDVPLHLACVRCAMGGEDKGTKTLTSLVQELAEHIRFDGTMQLFYQKLETLGFDRFDERYDDIHFSHTSTTYYRVVEGMPRLTPSDLLPGVTRVSYQIVTSDLRPFEEEGSPWSSADRSQ